MFTRTLRSYFGWAMLALLAATTARAEYFSGDTYLNFDARGQTSYNLTLSASIVPGGTVSASAYLNYGPFSLSNYGYMGEAGIHLSFSNIRKVNGQWVAEYVTVQTLYADASGWDYTTYTNVVLPSAGWATGSASGGGYSNPLTGSIY